MQHLFQELNNYLTNNIITDDNYFLNILSKHDEEYIKIMYVYHLIKKNDYNRASLLFEEVKNIYSEYSSYYKMVDCLLSNKAKNDNLCITCLENQLNDTSNKWLRLELFYLLKDVEPYKAWGYLEEGILIDENFNEAILQRVYNLDLVNDSELIINEILTLPQSYIDHKVLNYLGFAYYNLFDFDNAEKIALGSQELKENEDALYLLGLINMEHKNEYQIAIDFFNKSLELNPSQTDVITSKGWTLFDQGNIKDAEMCFNKLLEFVDDQESFNQTIQFYFKVDNLKKVKDLIFKSIEKNGTNYMNEGYLIILSMNQNKNMVDHLVKEFKLKYNKFEIDWLKNMISEYFNRIE